MRNMRLAKNTAAMLIAFAACTLTAFANAPANDNFANAEVLTGPRVSVVRSNVDATKEPGEPNHASNVGGRSVWFKYTATVRAPMVFSTVRTESNLDTVIHVYEGSEITALTGRASNNDISFPANRRSAAPYMVRPGDVLYIAVDGYNSGAGAAAGTFRLDINVSLKYQGSDYDGDGRTDLSIFRPGAGDWYILNSSTGQMSVQHYGMNGDIPVPATRQNGGNLPTVFRPSTGQWYGYHHLNPTEAVWGVTGDIPVPESYGGESTSQYAVFRPSNGVWYIYGHGGTNRYYHFGQAGDIPVPGRYSPDATADIAVFRPSTGVWYVNERINGSPTEDTLRVVQFGQAGDKPVPGDYDGDGLLDRAIYRPSSGQWWVLRSSDGQAYAAKWGLPDDIPTTGDYDGDGMFDFAVFRPSSGVWYIYQSSNQQARIQHFGMTGDIPVTSIAR
jgi:hypothetical protein